MHSLEMIVARNVQHVHAAMRAVLAEDTLAGYERARRIAKANLDLYVQDGRLRDVNASLYRDEGGEA